MSYKLSFPSIMLSYALFFILTYPTILQAIIFSPSDILLSLSYYCDISYRVLQATILFNDNILSPRLLLTYPIVLQIILLHYDILPSFPLHWYPTESYKLSFSSLMISNPSFFPFHPYSLI